MNLSFYFESVFILVKITFYAKFANFVADSIKKFLSNDWGITCEEDADLNNSEPEYAMGTYELDGEKIWIKRDIEIVTVLFPSEY